MKKKYKCFSEIIRCRSVCLLVKRTRVVLEFNTMILEIAYFKKCFIETIKRIKQIKATKTQMLPL